MLTHDRETHNYCIAVSQFVCQLRQIGHNYNQIVKRIHTNFDAKKAVIILSMIREQNEKIIQLQEKIIRQNEEIFRKYTEN